MPLVPRTWAAEGERRGGWVHAPLRRAGSALALGEGRWKSTGLGSLRVCSSRGRPRLLSARTLRTQGS